MLVCIAHDPGVRLRDIATTLHITERSAYSIVTDLTAAGYVVKNKDGRRNRYQIQSHLIRWFQLQSSTFVGLNTSRPERMRADTLRSMNALGRDLRVEFDRGLLHMNESGDQGDVVASKIDGLRAFTRDGYRPVAVVDHDPAVIRAMVEADETGDILFLHTRTTSPSRLTGPRTAAGTST